MIKQRKRLRNLLKVEFWKGHPDVAQRLSIESGLEAPPDGDGDQPFSLFVMTDMLGDQIDEARLAEELADVFSRYATDANMFEEMKAFHDNNVVKFIAGRRLQMLPAFRAAAAKVRQGKSFVFFCLFLLEKTHARRRCNRCFFFPTHPKTNNATSNGTIPEQENRYKIPHEKIE